MVDSRWFLSGIGRGAYALLAGASLAQGCATASEQHARRELAALPVPTMRHDGEQAQFDGTLQEYVEFALRSNAGLRAEYNRWKAGVQGIAAARRLPEPVISFGVFVRSVETRVGPQRARVAIAQSFPWPTRLSAGADAAAARARAQQQRFEAAALSIARQVSETYWRLWLVRVSQDLHRQHRIVLQALSGAVNARLVTGSATLAELQQVDLSAARLDDLLLSMAADERLLETRLRATLGLRGATAFPVTQAPPAARLPADEGATLRGRAVQHPVVLGHEQLADAARSKAEKEEAAGYPSFSVGADWIITGEGPDPNATQSGQDAVIVGGGISVPLWQGSYGAAAAAARSEAVAETAEADGKRDDATAAVDAALLRVGERVRRVELFRTTLVPQAEAAYESVLGAYTTGRGSVAAALLAQNELLSLRLDQAKLQAEYAIAWAELEQAVGGSVAAAPFAKGSAGGGAAAAQPSSVHVGDVLD